MANGPSLLNAVLPSPTFSIWNREPERMTIMMGRQMEPLRKCSQSWIVLSWTHSAAYPFKM